MTTVTFSNAYSTVFASEQGTALKAARQPHFGAVFFGALSSVGELVASPFKTNPADEAGQLMRLANSLDHSDPGMANDLRAAVARHNG